MERKEEVLEYDSSLYGKMNVVIDVSYYGYTNELRLAMRKKERDLKWGYGDMTVELASTLPKYCAYLDIVRFPEIEEFIVENGIGVFTGLQKSIGEVSYPLYLFNEEKLSEISPDGVQEYEEVNKNKADSVHKQRLFVDMDGTLAEFKQVSAIEELYQPGYFYDLKPIDTVLEGVRGLIKQSKDIEVYILSSVLSDSMTALDEKKRWLDKYLPEIPKENRIFLPCGKDKREYVPGGLRRTDCLLDDYTLNLKSWEPPARGIKVLNGINHTNGTWHSDMIGCDKSVEQFTNELMKLIFEHKVFKNNIKHEKQKNIKVRM